ncbi:MAG: THUMP-like domain-containing protein [Microbacter sp.]
MITWDDTHRQFLAAHRDDEIHSLLLHASRYPEINMPWIVQQMEGRRKAALKFPSLLHYDDFVFSPQINMEQASSETTARYKASLVAGQEVIDLTGGLGIDSFFMSQTARHLLYLERNEALFALAQHNFQITGASIETRCSDGLAFLQNTQRQADYLYVDPSRRDHNHQRVVSLEKYEPNVLTALPLFFQHAPHVLIKASPMLDISLTLRALHHVAKVHVVAVRNECKELLFDCVDEACNTEIVAVHFGMQGEERFAFSSLDEQQAKVTYSNTAKKYLYEPNVALLKAGAFRILSERFDVEKLHPASHLYTSDQLVSHFPGRIFEVITTFPLQKEAINQWIPSRKVNVTVRNFPFSVAEIRRKFRLEDGGNDYLFATTFADDSKRMILCKKKMR